MSWFAIKLFFAGIWPQVAHMSILALAILACIVIEFASGWLVAYLPILAKPVEWIQKHILVLALILGGIAFGEWLGAKDAKDRCDARAAVVTKEVHKAVIRATRPPVAGKRDKWDTDQ